MTVRNETVRGKTSRRGFLKGSAACAAGFAALSVPSEALAAEEPMARRAALAFVADGNQFPFDTGCLKGVLRPQGRSMGLAPVVDVATGTTVNQAIGLVSHYRLLETANRHGHAAWDWQSESQLLADGAVEAAWTADKEHAFDLKVVYRWAKPDTLDVVTTVTAKRALARFEVFLASYFNGFARSWVYAKGSAETGTKAAFVEASRDEGNWQMFPRDDLAIEMIRDGRWKWPPNPVKWAIRPTLAGPLGMRRDPQTGLVALVMAPPEDCFAVSTPHSDEGHRSLYLSLGGKDIQEGQRAVARSRLVIRQGISFEGAVRVYEEYLNECERI